MPNVPSNVGYRVESGLSAHIAEVKRLTRMGVRTARQFPVERPATFRKCSRFPIFSYGSNRYRPLSTPLWPILKRKLVPFEKKQSERHHYPPAFRAAASKCSRHVRCLLVGILAVEKYLFASYGKPSLRSILNPGFPGASGRRSSNSGSN